jgi:hypothetical protein
MMEPGRHRQPVDINNLVAEPEAQRFRNRAIPAVPVDLFDESSEEDDQEEEAHGWPGDSDDDNDDMAVNLNRPHEIPYRNDDHPDSGGDNPDDSSDSSDEEETFADEPYDDIECDDSGLQQSADQVLGRLLQKCTEEDLALLSAKVSELNANKSRSPLPVLPVGCEVNTSDKIEDSIPRAEATPVIRSDISEVLLENYSREYCQTRLMQFSLAHKNSLSSSVNITSDNINLVTKGSFVFVKANADKDIDVQTIAIVINSPEKCRRSYEVEVCVLNLEEVKKFSISNLWLILN